MVNKKRKTGPGRPKKQFIPKPKPKKSGPGRPKKQPKTYDLPGLKTRKKGFFAINLLHAPKKDTIILLLFIFSLLLFLFALYITILKHQNRLAAQLYEEANSAIANVQTGNIPYQQTQLGVQGLGSAPQAAVDLADIVRQFYVAFNQKDTETLLSLVDKPLRVTNTFKTYFSKNRITTFLNGIQGPLQVLDIQAENRDATSTTSTKLTYTLQYTLKDSHIYTEDRSVVLINREDGYKIGKIMCDTVKCSTMPFFNPGKYGIK